MRFICLETERLQLSPISLVDLDDLSALRANPEVMKYIGPTQTKEEVQHFIQCGLSFEPGISYFEKYGLDFFSVFDKSTDRLIGQAGLFHVGFNVHQPDIELAYRFHPSYWGYGYATESAKALIHYGFHKLSLTKIIETIHPGHAASKRVVEKVGMIFDHPVPYKHFDVPFDLYQMFI